jgi:hypothetical protein
MVWDAFVSHTSKRWHRSARLTHPWQERSKAFSPRKGGPLRGDVFLAPPTILDRALALA